LSVLQMVLSFVIVCHGVDDDCACVEERESLPSVVEK
jgi:hypothetical protein